MGVASEAPAISLHRILVMASGKKATNRAIEAMLSRTSNTGLAPCEDVADNENWARSHLALDETFGDAAAV